MDAPRRPNPPLVGKAKGADLQRSIWKRFRGLDDF